MTVFRLKQLASTSAHAAAGAIRWNYDRAELIADGIVHGIGVFVRPDRRDRADRADGGLCLGHSRSSRCRSMPRACWRCWAVRPTYNLWPVSRRKWVLRRFDHSAIYVLIAATYTPFFAQLQDSVFAMSLLAGVWGVAVVGIVLKLCLPGRFDRLSVGLYLAMGWSGVMPMTPAFPRCPNWRCGSSSRVACSTVSG